jgi:hypothetical protein
MIETLKEISFWNSCLITHLLHSGQRSPFLQFRLGWLHLRAWARPVPALLFMTLISQVTPIRLILSFRCLKSASVGWEKPCCLAPITVAALLHSTYSVTRWQFVPVVEVFQFLGTRHQQTYPQIRYLKIYLG